MKKILALIRQRRTRVNSPQPCQNDPVGLVAVNKKDSLIIPRSLLRGCLIIIAFAFFSFPECYAAPDDFTEKKKQAKELFGQRDDKAKLEQGIKLLEEITAKESDYQMFVLLSRAYYFLAEYTDENEQKLAIHDKGVKAGEMALNKVEKFAKAKKKKKAEEEAVKTITKDNLDALYWTAANLARWAKFASFSKKLSVKSRIRYLWDRVLELDPAYFYGGAYRFFGGYYALVPTITGENDPVKSKEMFDKSVAAAPEYLETKVLMAEAYCTHGKVKDRDAFKKLLSEVLNADISKNPGILAENKLAQAKAKKLLAQENELFE